MKRFSLAEWPALATRLRRPYHADYYAMYSSVYGGIVTDPVLMMLPLDDHMVHRGDGVFEALKTVQGRLYNLQGHLKRLADSAKGLALSIPVSPRDLQRIVIDTVCASGRRNCMVRIFVSRGPGGFSVNPYESPSSQLYVVVTRLGTPFMQAHPEGARIRTSAVPAKSSEMAAIKNCNYAPNVLMKKEAVDAKVDFTVGFDEQGFVTEGATENVGIVTADRRLLFPQLHRILYGTTMNRIMALAVELVRVGRLRHVGFADITREHILAAREILITGTTVNVAAVVGFDGHRIGTGRPGPVYRKLSALLLRDMRRNTALLTPVFS
jgi:branched-subunit amino acid aminotransferase/4-amino-4-deoxychorismate lyase